MIIKSKLPNTGLTIFSKMTALANVHNAINLAQGFPDFPSSPELIDLVSTYMKKGMNQYAPMPGILPLRERIAEKVFDSYNRTYHVDSEITITAGATQAIYTCIAALIHEGDEVIIFEPAYDSYIPAIKIHGGVPVCIQMSTPDYIIDWNVVKKSVSSKTKMIIINSPQNPTGTILSHNDLDQLKKIVTGRDIIILSDEVYEHILFDNKKHESILHYPELCERSMIVFSFGKTYHNTGWKIGYVLAPQNLTKEFRSVHQYQVFSVNTPMQYALSDFMKNKDTYTSLSYFYEEKRNLFCSLLKDSRFTCKPSAGTYFQLLGYDALSDKTDIDFADELTIQHKVASIPLSPFYKQPQYNKVLRFCFAKKDETLRQAAEILCKI